MIKKTFLIALIIFLTTGTMLCQDYNSATYRIVINKEKFSSSLDDRGVEISLKKVFLNMINVTNSTLFSLTFNDEVSMFQPIDQLSIGENNLKTNIAMLSLLNCEGNIYLDAKEKEYYIMRSLGSFKHLVKTEMQCLDWTIQEDKKIVNNINYRKATAIISNDDNSKLLNVEAWFCPSISVQYGPSTFYGLPGLITEVHITPEDKSLFEYSLVMSNLENNDTIDNIIIPLETYKVYTEEESNALYREAVGKFN